MTEIEELLRNAQHALREPAVPGNAWFTNSLKARRAEVAGRLSRVRKSLASLKNQDGEYAEGHRLLIAAYADELATLDRHRDAHVAQAS